MNLIESIIYYGSDVGMIAGGTVGYILQINRMRQEKNAEGFSPLVSFILITANLIRIFWYYVKRYDMPILIMAVTQMIVQFVLLYVWLGLK